MTRDDPTTDREEHLRDLLSSLAEGSTTDASAPGAVAAPVLAPRLGTGGGPPGLIPDHHLDAIVNPSATAWAVLDEEGVVTGWSEGAQRLLGHHPSDVIGRPAAGLLAAEIPEDIRDSLREVTRCNGTAVLRTSSGTPAQLPLIAHLRPAEPDGFEWLVVSSVPRTERPPADSELVALSFTQQPCTMALYDSELRLRRANRDMERVMGLTEGEMRGLRVSDLVPGPSGMRTEQAMLLALRTGKPQQLEDSSRLPSQSSEHSWLISLTPVHDGSGTVCGVCLTGHDVTEQFTARRRLALLNAASARIGSTLDLVRTAQELADVAVPELADFVTVELLPSIDSGPEPRPGPLPGTVLLRRVAYQSSLEGAPEAVVKVGEISAHPDHSPAAECLALGRPVSRRVTSRSLASWRDQTPDRVERMRTYGFHSVMAVPMQARGATLGVATFSRHRTPQSFDDSDLLLAAEITARAAMCIDNALRYTRERDTSLTLQRSLLPRQLPEQAAVDAAWRYLPAGTQVGVGGDWFDVIPLSGARVALVIGDVVGHGVQASATMGRLRAAVSTLADVGLPPDELLTHLDDLVNRLSSEQDSAGAHDGGGEIGATCLYAVYDPVSRTCSMARAGHLQPVLRQPDGRVVLLDLPAGPPLGFGGLPFESAEMELPEGSMLALYTDGLVEKRGRDIDEGIDALCSALSRAPESLEEACDAVLADLLPSRAGDDVALLLARTQALGTHQVATWDVPADPAAVGDIRRKATAQLAAWGLEDSTFTTEVVLSELVTNAIRHGAPPVQLRLIHDRTLICEVSDGSSTAPHLRRARTFDEGGRGLLLVAQLSARWGTRHSAEGKTIWAEQSLRLRA